MAALFDMNLRALRRDRAARIGPELFLHERAFADCLERVAFLNRRFASALLIGCPDPSWPARLSEVAQQVEVRDPGPLFAAAAGGATVVEDGWQPDEAAFDLVLAVGTLDTVDDLPLALRLIRFAMSADGLLIGAVAGGNSLPRLRSAMRAADALHGDAFAHVHPRIEPAALAPLLESAGFAKPVVDVDRVHLSYASMGKLVADLRAMGATNIMHSRAPALSRTAARAAADAFIAGAHGKTTEVLEVLHFAAWAPQQG